MILAAIPFGLGIGLSLGMLGGGGSVLAVPILVYILGQSVHQATTASLVIRERDTGVELSAAAAHPRPRRRPPDRRDDRFFGVGGGFLIVPTLTIVLALSMRLAVGTSLVIITATSLMALLAHLAAGRTLDIGVTLSMTEHASPHTCSSPSLSSAAPPGRPDATKASVRQARSQDRARPRSTHARVCKGQIDCKRLPQLVIQSHSADVDLAGLGRSRR